MGGYLVFHPNVVDYGADETVWSGSVDHLRMRSVQHDMPFRFFTTGLPLYSQHFSFVPSVPCPARLLPETKVLDCAIHSLCLSISALRFGCRAPIRVPARLATPGIPATSLDDTRPTFSETCVVGRFTQVPTWQVKWPDVRYTVLSPGNLLHSLTFPVGDPISDTGVLSNNALQPVQQGGFTHHLIPCFPTSRHGRIRRELD